MIPVYNVLQYGVIGKKRKSKHAFCSERLKLNP